MRQRSRRGRQFKSSMATRILRWSEANRYIIAQLHEETIPLLYCLRLSPCSGRGN